MVAITIASHAIVIDLGVPTFRNPEVCPQLASAELCADFLCLLVISLGLRIRLLVPLVVQTCHCMYVVAATVCFMVVRALLSSPDTFMARLPVVRQTPLQPWAVRMARLPPSLLLSHRPRF
jgi:hypothetical protein